MIHHLKIYPEHFSAACTGVKRAELRKNDRDFKVGDTLHLMETPKGSCSPTGEYINAVVTHIADVGEWLPGYVMLSIEREPGYAAPQLPQPAASPDLREAFEAWAISKGWNIERGVTSGDYASMWTYDAWEVVNACRASMLQGAEPVEKECRFPEDFDFDRFNDVVWLDAVASNPHMHSPKTSTIAMVALELNRKLAAGNSPVIPDGWVMVPVEPTAAMYEAGDRQLATKQVWDAMIAAAPQQEAENG